MFTRPASITRLHQGFQFLVIWAMLLFCVVLRAEAGQVTLAWNANTDTTLGGYKLHYGEGSRIYPVNIDVGNQTAYTISGLTEGKTYYFAATAYNTTKTAESGFSNEVYTTIPSTTAPVASFTASATSGVAPLVVTFNSTSTGNISSLLWSFGDGNSASSATVSKTYGTPGTYVVTLTASGSSGSSTTSKTVTVSAAMVADFTASVTSGMAPLTVNFTDASQGGITGWNWSFGDGTPNSTAQNPSHSYTTTGTYTVSLTVSGPNGSNTKTKSAYINVLASGGGGGSTVPGGLVAAYGFEEASGSSVVDASGNSNTGTISGAVRASAGRFGKALQFDGIDDVVSINDSASLDLSSQMTLEAWVYPTVWMSGWPTVLLKEDPLGDLAYAIYGNNDWHQPNVQVGGLLQLTGVTQVPPSRWTHLAGTYDGQYLRLFVDGVLVSMEPRAGAIPITGGPLRIGGNSRWGDYFTGYIDEVRIYNRALSEAEISADSKIPVGSDNVRLMWSAVADRSNAVILQGGTVKGRIYVFTTPDTSVNQIRFWLDNRTPTNPAGTPTTTENYAPFDFAGTAANGMAYPYDTSRLSKGTHTISVRATMADGSVKPAVVASFKVTR